jgi:hypothetical protein
MEQRLDLTILYVNANRSLTAIQTAFDAIGSQESSPVVMSPMLYKTQSSYGFGYASQPPAKSRLIVVVQLKKFMKDIRAVIALWSETYPVVKFLMDAKWCSYEEVVSGWCSVIGADVVYLLDNWTSKTDPGVMSGLAVLLLNAKPAHLLMMNMQPSGVRGSTQKYAFDEWSRLDNSVRGRTNYVGIRLIPGTKAEVTPELSEDNAKGIDVLLAWIAEPGPPARSKTSPEQLRLPLVVYFPPEDLDDGKYSHYLLDIEKAFFSRQRFAYLHELKSKLDYPDGTETGHVVVLPAIVPKQEDKQRTFIKRLSDWLERKIRPLAPRKIIFLWLFKSEESRRRLEEMGVDPSMQVYSYVKSDKKEKENNANLEAANTVLGGLKPTKSTEYDVI